MPRYTDEMKAFLKEGFLTLDYKRLTIAFNAEFGTDKTAEQIRSAIKNYRYRSGPNKQRVTDPLFDVVHIEWLREHYPFLVIGDLAAAFNAHFGTSFTQQQIYSTLKRHKIKSGRTGNFCKGITPWNKGLRGAPVHVNSTKNFFKPGAIPHNLKPIGHERIGYGGYVFIKTDSINPKTGKPGKYRQKQIVVWERHHGPAPAGHCIIFKDGDRQNCELENLMLVTRAQLAQLNKTGLIHVPAALKESAVATVELVHQLRQKEKSLSE